MSRVRFLARRYGFDVLIAFAAIESALEVALRHDATREPTTTRWVTMPAIALVVLPLLARRRFPFAAPASVWLLAAVFSIVDGRLIVFTFTASITGMVAAFLLGNLRDNTQARVGLAIVLSGAAIIVYNNPDHAAGEFIFTPVLFAIGWLAGFALRERAAQAEAAEARAIQAEREREAAARIAVAEERARIARELHDIVAHAVSVMVLQVGAVRHQLPQTLAEDRDALSGVEQAGRAALAEMRRLLGAMRNDGQGLELAPQPGLDRLDVLLEEVGRAGLPVRLNVDGEPFPLPRAIDLSAYRIVQEGLTNALKHARASHADVTVRYGPDVLHIDLDRSGVRMEPKTPQAVRDVVLMPTLVRLLREHKVGSRFSRDSDFVFASETGTALYWRNVRKRGLDRALSRASLDGEERVRLRWHDLRHTYASLLIAQGLNVVYVSRQLGHASGHHAERLRALVRRCRARAARE